MKEELNKVLLENKRRNNLEKLTSFELIELFIEVLKRIYKSSEMVKIINKNSEILELIKRIIRKEDK